MEETNCNLCGANETELIYTEKDRLIKLPGSFRLVRCRQCGLLYLNPRPSPGEIKVFYPPEYDPYTIAPEDEPSRIKRLEREYGFWKRARLVNAARPQGGRILDIGCATGHFLSTLRRLGPWEVCGLDISAEATDYARKRYAMEVFTGELAQAQYPSGHFDVVTLWDVLEHVHDPRDTLTEIHRILKPGGLLLVRVPNAATWDARLFGPCWVGYDAPRHLYVFTPATLRRYLEKSSFRINSMRTFLVSYPPFALSVQFWLDEHVQDGALKKALAAVNRSWIPRLATLPASTVLGYLNNTFITTAFATSLVES